MELEDLLGSENYRTLPRIPGTAVFAAFDGIDCKEMIAVAHGWGFDASALGSPLEVIVCSGGRSIGAGVTDVFRPDLARLGISNANVGFRVPLHTTGEERNLTVKLRSATLNVLIHNEELKLTLPSRTLSSEDVTTCFTLFFGRKPESDEAIENQLNHHKTKATLFKALMSSDEFRRQHPEIIEMAHARFRDFG